MSSYTFASKIKKESKTGVSVSRSTATAAAAVPSKVASLHDAKPPAVTFSASSPPKKRKVKGKEKRLKRYRSVCPAKIRQRIDRSLTQRMFLIQKEEVVEEDVIDGVYTEHPPKSCAFSILGSTGNCYEVKIQRLPSCSCPDHARGNLCKHVLFVLLKVMQVDPFSPLFYQSAWLTVELDHMFETMQQRFARVRDNNNVMANEKVQAAFSKMQDGEEVDDDLTKAKRQQVSATDDCPICFDALQGTGAANSIVFCRAQCGANFHKQCIDAWMKQPMNRKTPTCPCCRQGWDDGTKRNTEGYSNLGKLQGQASERDTSTYQPMYSPSYYGKRRRYF